MTLYETVFIVHPDKGGAVKEYMDKFKKLVEEQGGAVSHVEEWGMRDMTYRLKKQTKGYYTLLQHRSTPHALEELERSMKLSDGVLRYLTVRVDESASASRPPKPKEVSGRATSSEEDTGKVEPQT